MNVSKNKFHIVFNKICPLFNYSIGIYICTSLGFLYKQQSFLLIEHKLLTHFPCNSLSCLWGVFTWHRFQCSTLLCVCVCAISAIVIRTHQLESIHTEMRKKDDTLQAHRFLMIILLFLVIWIGWTCANGRTLQNLKPSEKAVPSLFSAFLAYEHFILTLVNDNSGQTGRVYQNEMHRHRPKNPHLCTISWLLMDRFACKWHDTFAKW